jgi:hypothetical protein
MRGGLDSVSVLALIELVLSARALLLGQIRY